MSYPRYYKALVLKYARYYEVDPAIIHAMMKVESKCNSNAISYSGAKGLMQIMDRTGKWGAEQVGIEHYDNDMLFIPEVNIQIGCWYISKLLKQYEGDIDIALAAYNAGSGNVAQWRNNPKYSLDGKTLHTIPFKETKDYVVKVKRSYKIYRFLYGTKEE